jgi:hypothetical protein
MADCASGGLGGPFGFVQAGSETGTAFTLRAELSEIPVSVRTTHSVGMTRRLWDSTVVGWHNVSLEF